MLINIEHRMKNLRAQSTNASWKKKIRTRFYFISMYLSVQANMKFHQSPDTLVPFHNMVGIKKVDSSICQACLQKPSPRTRQKHDFFLNKCLQTKTRPDVDSIYFLIVHLFMIKLELEHRLRLEAVKTEKSEGVFPFCIEANKMQAYLQAEKVHLPSGELKGLLMLSFSTKITLV